MDVKLFRFCSEACAWEKSIASDPRRQPASAETLRGRLHLGHSSLKATRSFRWDWRQGYVGVFFSSCENISATGILQPGRTTSIYVGKHVAGTGLEPSPGWVLPDLELKYRYDPRDKASAE